MKLGLSNISKIYVGAKEVVRAYLGSTQVYPTEEEVVSNLWTPAQMTTLAWYDAADASTVDLCTGTSNVCVWQDKSGNGHHATQDNADEQPLFVPTFQNSKPGIYFELNRLLAPSLHLTGTGFDCHCIINIVQEIGAPRPITLYHDGSDFGPGWMVVLLSINGGGISQSYQNTHTTPIFDHARDTTYMYRSSVDSIATFWVNTILRSQNNASIDLDTNGGLDMGNYNSPTAYFHGYLMEVIFTRTLETSTRQRVEGYLAHKWGLSANLPVDHPYKLAAP